MRLAILILLLQQTQPVPAVQSRDVRLNGSLHTVLVPHGWKVRDIFGPDIRVEHSSGALLIFRTAAARGIRDLEAFTRMGLDRTMQPLGFASFGDPLERKMNGAPAIQYEIVGNRLSERHKLLYVGIRKDDGFYEMVYENSVEDFDLLLREAERIAASIELTSVVRERSVVATIRALHAAEQSYRASAGRYATLNDLISGGILPSDFVSAYADYRLQVSLTGRGYTIVANPIVGASGRWAFESQQDGIIRYSSRVGLAPRGMAGRPIQ